MRIKELMTPEVLLTHPGDPLQLAAQLMNENDCGALPVAEGDRLVGMLTDRDIATRAVARGLVPARLMKAAWPEIIPPSGSVKTLVTPSTRATAMWALCGLIDQMAAMFGFISPSS